MEAFEMWVIRIIMKISCTQKIKNSPVLERAGVERQLFFTIKEHKMGCLGQVRTTKIDHGGKDERRETWNRL